VQNGLCYDDDNATVRYYEQPVANAGPDQNLCNIFTFQLAAVPYVYCGTEGVNYWPENHWELVGNYPDALFLFLPDVYTPNATVTISSNADCPYGSYVFKWVENNSKGDDLGGCSASDEVIVTIYEDPAPSAGPDLVFCDTWAFSLWGVGDAPCYENTVVEYSWEKTAEPGNCNVTIDDDNTTNPDIVISDCDPAECAYGKYTFELTQSNGYLDQTGDFQEVCASTDDKNIWIFQPIYADAGDDQHLCNSFSFTMTAIPTDFCGDPGVNYFTWGKWEFASGPASASILQPNNPNSPVTINPNVPCPYGKYTFKWTEYNGFGSGSSFLGCWDVDYVDIYIDEVPESVNAGPDQALCDMFTLALDGTIDLPCTENTAYSFEWTLVSQPDAATVDISGAIDPVVNITGGTGCRYGEYVFKLTQKNGYYTDIGLFTEVCSDFDLVSVWIFEPVDPDAGLDQDLCNVNQFALDATPTTFCLPGYSAGTWSYVGGPAPVVFDGSLENPVVEIQTGGVQCWWGAYTFRYTEKNGFFAAGADPRGWCEGYDEVTVYIYEPLDVNAGPDAAFCDLFTFDLDGSLAPLCNTAFITHVSWSVALQPDACNVTFVTPYSLDPIVDITNCSGCPYGDYIFKVRAENGYYDDLGEWQTVCWDEDEVIVTIYEHPDPVDAGDPQELCNDYTFDLSADLGADYCGVSDPWYSWIVVSQPTFAGCTVAFTNQSSPTTSVSIENCTGTCPYGEFVFRFTEWNGLDDCYESDIVTVTIFEMPDAQAGPDVNACIDIQNLPYCDDMEGELEYCYSMVGLWTKSCGPGDVVFEDINDPNSGYCVNEPGRYKFTWTVWNGAEGCEDEDEVIFDLLEQPIANAIFNELYAPCNTLCIDLGLAGVDKYDYIGTDEGDCPNYQDFANWSLVSGPGAVTFADDTDPETELCVSTYGGYTVRWREVNVAVDGESQCEDWVDVYVEFNETPEPLAMGGDTCGNCFTLNGTLDAGFGSTFYWEFVSGPCVVTFDPFEIDPEICIEDNAECYGTYTFKLHQWNGECEGTATATILFKQLPPPVAICYENNPNECGPPDGERFDYGGCLQPGDVFEACADGHTSFSLNPWCECTPGFDWNNPTLWGFTFEWNVIAPSGTNVWVTPGYFDFENGSWIYPELDINWGECCDTARIYLIITSDDNCELALEYKAYVHHKPCIDIIGPDVSEVGMVAEYCNNCPPDPCYLYNWTAEHCGIIQSGENNECIEVLWTDYNVNDGWGEITLTIFDTCTGCCNYDEMMIKILPTGTLGNETLSGTVFYDNNFETPLNGAEITLWNGGVPVMTTTSFNQIINNDPPPPTYIPGYYEFTGINGTTIFGITVNYDAPWFGANATDALAVELKYNGWPNGLPAGFIDDVLAQESMDVTNLSGINGTDALWIKQRAINMVSYFPAGDWAYLPNMSTTAGTFDIPLLNMGDVNRTNIPGSMKSVPAIELVNDGMMNVVNGQVFDLPIRIEKENIFGAMTLELEYNSALIEVVDVNAVEGILSNITPGMVSMAWSNVNPMALTANDVVVTLKVKAIGAIASTETLFNIGINSEFADAAARVVEPVTLKSFGVTTEPAALDYFLSANRPNPFSTSTFIEYTMPETGKVKLSVLDMLGQELEVLVDATQTAGSYTVEFSAAGLATGVYIYKITVDGETRDFISTQRMVVSQ